MKCFCADCKSERGEMVFDDDVKDFHRNHLPGDIISLPWELSGDPFEHAKTVPTPMLGGDPFSSAITVKVFSKASEILANQEALSKEISGSFYGKNDPRLYQTQTAYGKINHTQFRHCANCPTSPSALCGLDCRFNYIKPANAG